MKLLYLHIGTPKTGTSTIQYFCHLNNDFLLKHGLCYPDLGFRFPGIGQNRNAYFLSHKIYDDQKNRLPEAETALRNKGFCKLEKIFEKQERVLISDEHLWNEKEINTVRLKQIQERMAKAGVTVKAIVYLRRQEQVIQSYWAQKVKEGMRLSFSKYMKKEKFRYFQLDYEKRLQEFADAFGRENIIVRCFETGQYQGTEHTLISDFLNIFDIAITEECRDIGVNKNESLMGNYLETKRLLNQNPAFRTKQNFIVERLLQLQESDEEHAAHRAMNYFSKKEKKLCAAQYAMTNEQVARKFLGREDGKLFYEESFPEEDAVPFSMKELAGICGSVIAMQEQEIEQLKEKLERKTLRGKLKRVYHTMIRFRNSQENR